MELWKQDQEKPSVFELISNMRQHRQEEKTTEKEFN